MNKLLLIANLAKSSYYDAIKRLEREDKDKWLKNKIKSIYEKHKGRYGYIRTTIALNNDKEVIAKYDKVNHKRIYRLMKLLGLQAKTRIKKYKSYKGNVGRVAENILDRNFTTSRPLEKVVTDVTEFKVCGEKIYLSPAIDLNTSEIISYSISRAPNVDFVMDMLKKGFRKRTYENLIIHSDQGFQYQSYKFINFLRERGIKQSMSRKGNCYDNACAENFFSNLKSEFFYLNKFNSVEEFIDELKEYMHYYNNIRVITKLKMTPIQYRDHQLGLI